MNIILATALSRKHNEDSNRILVNYPVYLDGPMSTSNPYDEELHACFTEEKYYRMCDHTRTPNISEPDLIADVVVIRKGKVVVMYFIDKELQRSHLVKILALYESLNLKTLVTLPSSLIMIGLLDFVKAVHEFNDIIKHATIKEDDDEKYI